MSPPKAVVFDLGKVLLDFDYQLAAERIASRGKCDPTGAFDFLLRTPVLLRYEAGQLSEEEFYRSVCEETGYQGTAQEFGICFGNIFKPIEPMIELQAELRKQFVFTAVFSNTNSLAVKYIRDHFPFFGRFDAYILSYEVGVMKPEPGIYEALERSIRKKGRDLLYIDDRAENIATAQKRGWNTILHESPEKTISAVRGAGFEL